MVDAKAMNRECRITRAGNGQYDIVIRDEGKIVGIERNVSLMRAASIIEEQMFLRGSAKA